MGALSHLKVLDLSRILAGPWCGQCLGDLGAEVIKIEHPDGGDDTRKWAPPYVTQADGSQIDGAYFTACNRTKRSVVIDFSTRQGAALVAQLAEDADLVIENFKVGGLAKYGLDYDTLKQKNPGLIYCSITGFGQTGPYAHRAGYDYLIQAMGGLMSITGQPDGQAGGGPVKVGVAVSDLFTGMYATVAILAAIAHRERTGEGQHIDCALFDCQTAMLANQASNWLVGGINPERMGNAHPNVVPYRSYQLADGHAIIACGNDSQFARLMTRLGRAEIAEDDSFRTAPARVLNRERLEQILEGIVIGWRRDELIAALEEVGVPCGPINEVRDVFADPHARARGVEVPMTQQDGTVIPTVAFPARFGRTPPEYRTAPPQLGTSTDEVLSERLGLDSTAIKALKESGIIG